MSGQNRSLSLRARLWLIVLAVAVIVVPLIVMRSCSPLNLATIFPQGQAAATAQTVIRDRYETVRVAVPHLRLVSAPATYIVEHDTIVDTAIVRSLVATLDSARRLLRERGIRTAFSLDTAILPNVERLYVLCDETARRVSIDVQMAARDTILHRRDTTTLVTLWAPPIIEPYVQAAAVYSATGQWTAQATVGARLNLTRYARPFADAQAELGGTPRIRLGLDVVFK